ncbi:MAG: hypothetical protein M1561_06750 [Gammaproteobacteria bacterium]|nr:hypothetical protein [Gammaproteobacteria bacterium]
MKKLTSLFLSCCILIISTSVFADFNALEKIRQYAANYNALESIQLYTAKKAYLTIYDVKNIKSIIALFPKGTQFIGHKISGNDRPGYKFLVARNYKLIGYAKETDLTKLAIPNDRYEQFQLLLDDYNIMQRIEIGGTFASIIGGNIESSTLEIYVHEIFTMADVATRKQYAKEMYQLWKMCNPKAEHLSINFVSRSLSGINKVVFKIQDGVIVNS